MTRDGGGASSMEHVQAFRRVLTGFMLTRLLVAATKLGIPEALVRGPVDAGALAETIGADPLSVRRLMQGLVAAGVFREDAAGRFHLTPMSEMLLEDHPASLRPAVLYYAAPYVQNAWAALERGSGFAWMMRASCCP